MLLLSFSRNSWQLGRTEKQGASVMSKGFSTWKKAPKCFYSHQDSACHQATSDYHLIVSQCNDVGEMIDDQITRERQVDHKYLIDVIKYLRYLACQQPRPRRIFSL